MAEQDPPRELRRSPKTVLFMAAVGLLALGAVVLTLFFSLGRRPRALWQVDSPPVEAPEFMASVAGLAGSPAQRGGTAHVLNDGDEFFPRLLDAIGGAQRSVNFSVYIWEDGAVSRQILAALTERARAGVPVRVLLDAVGSMDAPSFEELEQAGGRVATFRGPRIGMLTRFYKRNHRRAIVIDGVVGFTGGMAVGDKWQGRAQDPQHWRDMMVEVTGPLATSLQSAFASAWAHTSGEMLVGHDYFPPIAEAATQTLGGRSPDPEAVATTAGHEAVRLHTTVLSSPSSEDHPLRLVFMQSILSARRRLYLATPYFVPDAAMASALAARARAGVDVRLLLPNEQTDAAPVRWAAQASYEDLLAAGVRVYEFQPTFMHAKYLVVDGLWSVVGSANMNVRSRELDEENVLGILDAGLAGELETTFVADLGRSREIGLDAWKLRGRGQRMRERIGSLFREQF